MEKVKSVEDNSNNPINTYVFFDLETTGFSGKKKICELAMIVISRENLVSMENSRKSMDNRLGPPLLPRILHKFTKLFYPNNFIDPICEEITGLSNAALEDLSPFTKETAEALKIFLNFPRPICFVAHNGNAFDFPVLKAELQAINSDVFTDILCVDSLHCFRALGKENEPIFEKIIDESVTTNDKKLSSFSINVGDELIDGIIFNGPLINEEKELKILNKIFLDHIVNGEESDILAISPITSGEENGYTSNFNNERQSFYETPSKLIKNHEKPIPATPKKLYSPIIENTHGSQNFKRSLTYNKKTKTPYSQPILYERLFGINYDAHRAESDAIALMQICASYGNKFLDWADANFTYFKDVKAGSRYSFRMV